MLIEEKLNKYFDVKENETVAEIKLRKTLLEKACEVNHASCLNWAENEFNKWMEFSDSTNGYDFIFISSSFNHIFFLYLSFVFNLYRINFVNIYKSQNHS